MAPQPTKRTASTKASKVVEVVEDDEVFEDEFEDADEDTTDEADGDELEDAEDDEAPAEKPKAKRTPPVRPKIAFGSPELAALVTEKTGEKYDARAIRMLLRKMAKDGKLDRVVGEDKARYEFSGPEDPTVKAVIKMVTSGEAKELKQAGLQKVKDQAAAKKAAAKAAKEAATEDEGDDMEEVDEAPKPRRRASAAAKPTTPAKATPAKATRRASAAK